MNLAAKLLVAALTLAYLFFVLAGRITPATRLGWEEFALVVFVVLLLGNFFDYLAELSFGKEGLHIIRRIESKQQVQESDLAAVKIALSGLVTKYEYAHLVGLNQPGPYKVQFGNIFFDEIRRLDAIGFIHVAERNGRGFNAIKDDHESNRDYFDLKDYMRISNEGQVYIQARTQATFRDVPAAATAERTAA